MNWKLENTHALDYRYLRSRQAIASLLWSGLVLSLGGLWVIGIPISTSSQTPDREDGAVPLTIARPTLRPGSEGFLVAELQATLRLLNFFSGTITGMYDESTAIAVAAFQRAAGLEADGVVGVATWNRLLPPALTPSPLPSSASAPASPAPPQTPVTPIGDRSPASSTSPSRQPAPTSSPAPQATAEPVDLPVLRLGVRGPAVVRLQQRLRTIGVFNGEIDGIFGTATQSAVRELQRTHRLTPDGIVGAATWSILLQ